MCTEARADTKAEQRNEMHPTRIFNKIVVWYFVQYVMLVWIQVKNKLWQTSWECFASVEVVNSWICSRSKRTKTESRETFSFFLAKIKKNVLQSKLQRLIALLMFSTSTSLGRALGKTLVSYLVQLNRESVLKQPSGKSHSDLEELLKDSLELSLAVEDTQM